MIIQQLLQLFVAEVKVKVMEIAMRSLNENYIRNKNSNNNHLHVASSGDTKENANKIKRLQLIGVGKVD